MAFADTLRDAQAGDALALGTLWRTNHPRLLRFLRVRDLAVADDVASETWLRVARGLHGFSGNETQFRAWLFTIARHVLIDGARRERRQPFLSGAGDLGEVADDRDVADEALESIDTSRIVQLVSQLPEAQAEAVLLCVVAGLDAPYVGQILSKRPGAVRVLQHRGLRRLAELINEGGTPFPQTVRS